MQNHKYLRRLTAGIVLLLISGIAAEWQGLQYTGGCYHTKVAARLFRVGPTLAQAAESETKDGRKIDHWVAPMDPTFISDKPGKSPMGMDLVPVYATNTKPTAAGTVIIDPVVVQNMGVRVAPVIKGSVSRHIRTLGEVDVAESEISVVNLRFSGWIERVYADETGRAVKRGQKLFSIYSPELVSAQKEYLLAYKINGAKSELTKSAAERLRLWQIPESVLQGIVRRRKVARSLTITAPRSGYILYKDVVDGTRVKAGADLYRIGNLEKIWVTAEVYEFDAPWVKVGQKAEMELSFQRGKQYTGRVKYIYPTLNRKSRTLKVRLEFANPGIALKPGMFATVRIEAQKKEDVLRIPTAAILHSGERQIVFITPAVGHYEAREIVTGLVGDGHVTEVLSGLEPGDTVVTSGQFLLDSESQLQEAVQKLLAARLQAKNASKTPIAEIPAPNMPEMDHSKMAQPPSKAEPDPTAPFFTCPMHPTIIQDGPGNCPICGMNLVEKKTP